MVGVIYKATSPYGKVYVGQTKNFEWRLRQHQYESSRLTSKDYNCMFYRALRKYGFENFVWEILEDNIQTQELLNDREKFWIENQNSYLKGYNRTLGGDLPPSQKGKVRTQETRDKLSKALSGKKKMGRKKKPGFTDMKMLASRIEKSDYDKFEAVVEPTGKSLQEFMNLFIVNCISGTIALSGSTFISRT